MPNRIKDAADLALTQYGGLVTAIYAPGRGLPAGASPNCQDNIYPPDSVETRPGALDIFAALTAQPRYMRSYKDSQEQLHTLILAGNLYEEFPLGASSLTELLAMPSGSYGKSVTAFGREYIALSDGEHGNWPPVQFDTSFGIARVSQCAPGQAPSASDFGQTLTIEPSPNGLIPETAAISSISQSGNTVTVVFGAGLSVGFSRVGDTIGISGTSSAYDNDAWPLSAILGPNAIQFTAAETGLPTLTSVGTITSGIVQVTLAAAGFMPVATAEVAGAGVAAYDGTWSVRGGFGSLSAQGWVYIPPADLGSSAASGGGTITTGGSIVAGEHLVTVFFVSNRGYWTKYAPPTSWTAAGGLKTLLVDIATGPPNTVARIVAFTAAGGADFYTIPSTMTINDNATTSLIVDFTDTNLLAGTSVDYLLNLIELGEVAGFFEKYERLFAWGERNKLTNTNNLSFDGGSLGLSGNATVTNGSPNVTLVSAPNLGAIPAITGATIVLGGVNYTILTALTNAVVLSTNYTGATGVTSFSIPSEAGTPLGWSYSSTDYPGGLGPGVIPSGNSYQISAELSPGTTKFGRIFQSVAQWLAGDPWSQAFATASGDNGELVPIIQPNVGYSVRAKFKQTGGLTDGALHVALWSPTAGFFAGNGISIAATAIGTTFAESIAVLIAANTAIPSDAIFQVWADGLAGQIGVFSIDDIEIFPTLTPYNIGVVRGSLAASPESFDGETGLIEPDEEDGLDIRTLFEIRDNLYLVKEDGGKISVTATDGVNEPADWQVDTIASTQGTSSINGATTVNNWALIFNRNGLFVFNGAMMSRVSEEIQPTWDSVNWDFGFTGWVAVNARERYALMGLPFGSATSPSKTLFFSYRELDGPQEIVDSPPPHVTMFGVRKVLPKCRKWSPWTLAPACAAMIERPTGVAMLWLGLATAAAQITPGQRTDNGAAIPSFYWTHFFPDAVEQLQALVARLQKNSNRWQMRELIAFAEGAGGIVFAAAGPGGVTLVTFDARTLSLPGQLDIKLPCSVTAEGIQIQIATDGNAGSWYHVGKLTPWFKAAPWAPTGAGN